MQTNETYAVSEQGAPLNPQLPTVTSEEHQKITHTLKPQSGLQWLLWSKMEAIFTCCWFVVQTFFLIAGLTVLHFSTFSVMVAYLLNGAVRRRREFRPNY
ncbi:unnamed protein product [Candidula unifasciata]|uniref:Uncharacterized protein n=1 Tax=Candidula unifasciata TaxID=100452 RepID=A0A8S3YHY5_9EUPU|nr:unnamed protein product [Candidula unifasciata]